MVSPLRIKLVRFDSGERFPMLVRRNGGMPLFNPTVYAISMIRARNVASATISRNLQAIMHLYAWAEIGRFDLEKRFSRGEFLNISEIDSLTEALGNRLDHYCKIHSAAESDLEALARPRVRSIEKYRIRSRENASSVDVATKAVRLRYARGYLDWLAGYHLRRNLHESKKYVVLENARRFMAEAINARVPTVGDKGFLGQRVGFSLTITGRVPTFRTKAWIKVMPPLCRMPHGQ